MVGLLDWFMGSGDYADPNKIDPRYGVPMSDVRQAGLNTIANLSATLLAAGQGGLEPGQRAAYLAQLGQAAGGMNTDLYNASQRRLMQTQMQERQREAEEGKRFDEMIRDPAQLQALGITPQQAMALGRGGLRQFLANRLSQSPEAAERARLELEALRSGADTRQRLNQAIDADPSLNEQQRVIFRANPELYAQRFSPPSFRPMTPEDRATYGIKPDVPAVMTPQGPKVISGGGVTVNLGNKASETAATKIIESNIADIEAGRQSVENINQSNQIRALLDEGVITGFGAEGRAMLGNAAQALGFRADDPRIANTYTATTQLANRVLSAAQNMKGALSDKDIEFLKQASGGSVSLPEASIRRILDLADKVDRRVIDRGRAAATDIGNLPALRESGIAESSRLKIDEPKPYQKQFTIDGQSITAKLGVDGRYFVVRDGRKFFVEE